jgi:hypothetical protein
MRLCSRPQVWRHLSIRQGAGDPMQHFALEIIAVDQIAA